ncbi:hypothetical protein [Azospirillum argentinense]
MLASKLMKDIADELEKLTDNQVEMLANGELELRFTLAPRQQRKAPKDAQDTFTTMSSHDLIEKLNKCNDRQDARELIESMNLTKKNLQDALKAVNANVSSSDNRDTLVDRLISSTIGVRLRSEAIQSLGSEQ